MSEFNFYQIDHTGVNEPDRDDYARTDVAVPIRRAADMKISNFGAKNVGASMSSDYTRTVLYFQSKDELSDWNFITGVEQEANRDENPYVLGSTIKRVRDDQFFRMGMSNDRGTEIDEPGFDVMDTNLVDASSMVSGKNWPSEGYRSFGGKYDFSYPYYTSVSGVLEQDDDVTYMGGGIH
jgi:hypothetical protein